MVTLDPVRLVILTTLKRKELIKDETGNGSFNSLYSLPTERFSSNCTTRSDVNKVSLVLVILAQ